MAEQWIVTGKFSVRAAAQMVAGILAQLAIEDGVKALHEVAEGFAAEAITWGIPNPSSTMHFAAASAYGISAAETGAAAALVGLASRIGASNSAGSTASAAASGSVSAGSVSSSGSTSSSGSSSNEVTNVEGRILQQRAPEVHYLVIPKGMMEKAVVDGINRRTMLHGALVKLIVENT